MSWIPPEGTVNPYPRRKSGYAGELGQGAHVNIKFLQTAIKREELDNIDLIENIPGSEKWDVKDLFQRTVDKERVGKSILPYLQDNKKVKFFNPLTLVLLPFDSETAQVEKELEYMPVSNFSERGHEYEIMEKEGFYRIAEHSHEPAFSFIEWNEQKVKVVAIDGQHRLSALKRWKDDPTRGHELSSWSIPVVILAMFKDKEEGEAPNILEVVRKTFIYINSTAKEINESRRILLDDESVNCICSQEVIQFAHENDQKTFEKMDMSRLPLMFFDWRGEVVNDRPHPGPAAIKSVEELQEWFKYHLLGEDGSDEQGAALNLDDMVPPLDSYGVNKKLTHEDSDRVRGQFTSYLLSSFRYLMETFKPYENYIYECRKMQREAELGDDLAKHAFQKICFGTHRAGPELIEAVDNRYHEIVMDFVALKQEAFQELIARDVGMRGVWSAFGVLKEIVDQYKEKTVEWMEFSKWFTNNLNTIYDQGWFKSWESQARLHQGLLTHIVFDPAGGIVNYKHSDVRDAFGSLLALLIVKADGDGELQERSWIEISVNLRKPLKKGFRKQFRAELRNTFSGSQVEFTREVNRLADEAVNIRMDKYRKYIESDT